MSRFYINIPGYIIPIRMCTMIQHTHTDTKTYIIMYTDTANINKCP